MRDGIEESGLVGQLFSRSDRPEMCTTEERTWDDIDAKWIPFTLLCSGIYSCPICTYSCQTLLLLIGNLLDHFDGLLCNAQCVVELETYQVVDVLTSQSANITPHTLNIFFLRIWRNQTSFPVIIFYQRVSIVLFPRTALTSRLWYCRHQGCVLSWSCLIISKGQFYVQKSN